MPLNRPTREELLQASIDYLRDDLLPTLDGSQRFHLRVVLRILATVQRELQQGEAYQQREQALLEAFCPGEEKSAAALCSAIAEGDSRLDEAALIEALVRLSEKKLAIDSPDYSGSDQ